MHIKFKWVTLPCRSSASIFTRTLWCQCNKILKLATIRNGCNDDDPMQFAHFGAERNRKTFIYSRAYIAHRRFACKLNVVMVCLFVLSFYVLEDTLHFLLFIFLFKSVLYITIAMPSSKCSSAIEKSARKTPIVKAPTVRAWNEWNWLGK